MGLANLVPGISGGTMLLITGVYPGFIGAIAEITTLRWRWSSVVLLGTIGGAAVLAILLLAGPTKTLVITHRWVMYSLFHRPHAGECAAAVASCSAGVATLFHRRRSHFSADGPARLWNADANGAGR